MFHVDKVWMQHGLDTLEEMFRVGDATKRDMIQFLFDAGFWDAAALSWRAAEARFNANLNPNKPEFFKLAEIWALAKAFRRHGLLHAMAEDLGYQRLREKPTEERRQELLSRMATAQEALLREFLAAKSDLTLLEELEAPARLHPAIQEGRGLFSVLQHGTSDPRTAKEDETAPRAVWTWF